MKRRNAIKTAAGVLAGGGIGLFSVSNLFKEETQPNSEPVKLDYSQTGSEWKYVPLNPDVSAERAYEFYAEGGCMYSMVKCVISQLAENIGKPYDSMPLHMFKYGHGGIGGYGTVCGTLNGAAALISLLVPDKTVQDKMIADIFHWYETKPLPSFIPARPALDYDPVKSISNSVLCHAANTNWCKKSGFNIGSNERKEKCRRLTADVAKKITIGLNELHSNNYMANAPGNEIVGTCISCHGKEGKLKNVSGKMSCSSCHTESIAHRVFSDAHYKLIKE